MAHTSMEETPCHILIPSLWKLSKKIAVCITSDPFYSAKRVNFSPVRAARPEHRPHLHDEQRAAGVSAGVTLALFQGRCGTSGLMRKARIKDPSKLSVMLARGDQAPWCWQPTLAQVTSHSLALLQCQRGTESPTFRQLEKALELPWKFFCTSTLLKGAHKYNLFFYSTQNRREKCLITPCSCQFSPRVPTFTSTLLFSPSKLQVQIPGHQ